MRSDALTRREWMTRAGAGGAVALTTSFSLAQTRDRRALSFLVISDTHVGYKGRDAAERQWAKTAAELADARGDFVLHLGDVVDGGRVEKYPVYLESRALVGKPVHEIPGNHDPADAFAKHIRRDIDAVVDYDWLRIVLLNNSRRTSHDGFFSDQQLDWFDRQCQAAAGDGRFVIVCCHVPVHRNRHPDRGWYVKPEEGQTRFYEIISRHHETVVSLFHGHFHNGIRGWDDREPIHEICFPSVLYNLNRRLEEQMAPGYNLDEFRPGYCLATIGDGELKLQYKPLGAAATVKKTIETSS